jgi:hypothetical protein
MGPQYIYDLAKLVPDLEEISLDQFGMLKATPLPGDLVSSIPDGVCVGLADSVPLRLGRLGRSFSSVQETSPHRIRQHVCS